jgi:hypothetical protein
VTYVFGFPDLTPIEAGEALLGRAFPPVGDRRELVLNGIDRRIACSANALRGRSEAPLLVLVTIKIANDAAMSSATVDLNSVYQAV